MLTKFLKIFSIKNIALLFCAGFLFFGLARHVNATTPDQISGLKLWLDASQGVTKDGSTPAVDGDTVQQWNDLSTSVANATQATAGNRPTYKTNIMNGHPVLRFNGSPQNMATASFLNSSFDTNFTFFIVTSKVNASIEAATSNGGTNWYSGGQSSYLIANTGHLTPVHITKTPVGTDSITNPTIQTFKYDGANATIRVNGTPKTALTSGNLGLSGALTIGSLSSNAFYYHGDIAEIIIYNSVLNDTQIGQIESYLMTKYGITSSLPSTSIPLFVFYGDSMTYGNGSTGGQTYPFQTQTLLGLTATYQNLGVPSQTVANMITDAPEQIDPEYSGSRTTNVISLLGGTNDLAVTPNQDANTTYNRIVSYSQARRVAGFKVIVNTILPRSLAALYNITENSFETSRQTVNSLIRANWTTFADGISDVASDPNIGQAGDSDNLTYYADGVHPTNTGYGVIASYVTAAIKQIMNPIVVSNISATPLATTATIAWTTNQTGSTKINYGSSSSYGLSTTETDTTTRVLNHSTGLSSLVAGTTYHFQTVSTDLNGNQATSTDQIFTTLNTSTSITSFNFASPSVTGTVDNSAHTVALTVPFGTSVTSLTPTIILATGATISPTSGTAQNFSSPVTYTVTAQDGSTQNYVVTVTVALNTTKAITAFDFDSLTPAVVGSVNEGAKTVTLTVPFGTVLTNLVPTITINGSSVSPASGIAGNFTTPQTYRVTAADSSHQDYVVTVNVAANTAKAITAFDFDGLSPAVVGTIDETGKTISLTVPYGTAVTALVPTITINGSSVSPASLVAQDFSTPTTYTVTAADSSHQDYIVTVSVGAAPVVISHGGGGMIIGWNNLPIIPTGGFKIFVNSGASTTTNRIVSLNFNAGPDVKKMAISMTGDFADASQENYSPTKQIDLCSKFGVIINPTCPNGKYTIYVKFYTQFGVTSPVASSSITLTTNTTNTTIPALVKYNFTRNLSLHTTGADVKTLQQFLNANGFVVAKTGAGSPGKETTLFGTLTYRALVKFQKSIGWSGTGFFGPMTREYIFTH